MLNEKLQEKRLFQDNEKLQQKHKNIKDFST